MRTDLVERPELHHILELLIHIPQRELSLLDHTWYKDKPMRLRTCLKRLVGPIWTFMWIKSILLCNLLTLLILCMSSGCLLMSTVDDSSSIRPLQHQASHQPLPFQLPTLSAGRKASIESSTLGWTLTTLPHVSHAEQPGDEGPRVERVQVIEVLART